jgi:hypothetical protein
MSAQMLNLAELYYLSQPRYAIAPHDGTQAKIGNTFVVRAANGSHWLNQAGGGTCPDNITIGGGALDTGCAAGSHTYTLQAKYIGGGSNIKANASVLKITELKR